MMGKLRKLGIVAVLMLSGTAFADEDAGAFLAATQANYDDNYKVAAKYYGEALEKSPDNIVLQQNAVLSMVAAGEFDKAIPIAKRRFDKGGKDQLTALVLLTDHIKNKRYDEAIAMLEDSKFGFGTLLSELMLGWMYVGQGNMEKAEAQFVKSSKDKGTGLFARYNHALALASDGQFEKADKIFDADKDQSLNIDRSAVLAHVQILMKLDRREDAIKLLDKVIVPGSESELTRLRKSLKNGGEYDYTFVTSATDGASVVYSMLGSLMGGESSRRLGLFYGRLAEELTPNRPEVKFLVADLLREQEQYDLAIEIYGQISHDSALFVDAELGRASALIGLEKNDAAIEVYKSLKKAFPYSQDVLIALADKYLREDKFAESINAYNDLLALLEEETENHWFIFYSLGIANERENHWGESEKNFRKALKLSPDQASVLNYLGYSMVEKGVNLDEAERMIRKAVRIEPNDGAITDSLGWVLYRVGKFKEAVPHLERAAELMPVDPIVNDHLGDSLWKVGRQREAIFQWKRALSFEPDEKDAIRIRRKLELGLDDILAEESGD